MQCAHKGSRLSNCARLALKENTNDPYLLYLCDLLTRKTTQLFAFCFALGHVSLVNPFYLTLSADMSTVLPS